MKVLKFGGTSVANAERIAIVTNIIKDTIKTEGQVVVVVSALGGVTDMLINAAKKAEQGEPYEADLEVIFERHSTTIANLFGNHPDLKAKVSEYIGEREANLSKILYGVSLIRELSNRVLDRVSSAGEVMSSFIVANYASTIIEGASHLDSRTVMKTDSSFGGARVNFEKTNASLQVAISPKISAYIMGGFVASNDNDVTTTLGRGGSDYTAAIVGAALGANEVEIWTDVDGVMTTDPRKVKEAFSLKDMTYEEAMEMSHFGAKVIHPPTMRPVMNKQIPLRIRNTFNTAFPGTIISNTSTITHAVRGITVTKEIALLTVQGAGMHGVAGIAARLFGALAQQSINIILITQASSEHSISFAVKPEETEAARQAIEQTFSTEIQNKNIDPVHIEPNLVIVAVVGSNMKNNVGVSGRSLRALGTNGINVRAIAQGSSELNISMVIDQAHSAKALNAIHSTFFTNKTKAINLFIVGTGLIGKTLIQQIEAQKAFLLEKHSIEIRLTAISNSRKMYFDADGMNTEKWATCLKKEGEKASLPAFIAKMKAMNLENSIFIDCTASTAPIAFYNEVLSAHISIVTPNKIANTGSFANYVKLRQLADKAGVKFLYETNVGAGLPVISTLTDLLKSGDEILKIEAVLSGSLSFIFNNFVGDAKFSDVVKQAKEKGYTEPDPRDDLSGKDVARKVLILSREIGQEIELSDIDVQNILPQACSDAETVDAFFDALVANDDYFAEMRNKAAAEGKVLRFLASIAPNEAKVSLKAVDANDPFYGLSGSDNMIVFTTKRYNERPLVVKGPGAGAEVTAAGVFAEIIAISNYLA